MIAKFDVESDGMFTSREWLIRRQGEGDEQSVGKLVDEHYSSPLLHNVMSPTNIGSRS